jgi:hypothetical protein
MKSRLTLLLALLALIAGVVTSTSPSRAAEEEPAGPKVLRPAAAGDARVRVVHASADAPAVDVYVDDSRVLSNVPFGAVSDYLDVPPGERRIRVVPAGGAPVDAVINVLTTLVGNQSYTVAACRPLAGNAIATPCVTEDSLAAPDPGEARVRLFHYAAPPTPSPVDVRVGDGSGAEVINDAAYLAAPVVAEVAAGSYDLAVTTEDGSTVATTLKGVQLQAGKIYDLFAVGVLGQSSFRVLSTITEPGAQVRVVHAVSGAPAVDVYVDGALALSNVPFFALSDYLTVPAGARSVSVTVTGTTTPIIGPANLSFEAGRSYTVAARGTASNPLSIGVEIYLDDRSTPAAGRARVRVLHLSPDAPAVTPFANGMPLLFSSISYPNASPYIDVPAGTYNVEARVTSGAAAITLPFLTLEEGRIYDIFAVDQVARIRGEVRITETSAKVRVVHASPTAGDVDIYVDAARVAAGVPFQAISDYLTVQPGLRRVRVVPAGANPDAVAAIDATLSFEAGKFYTVAARNDAAAITASVFVDSTGVAADGRAKVRVYHLSSAVNAVTPTGVDVRVAGGATLINDLTLGNSATIEVPAGSYNLEVTNASGALVLATLSNTVAEGRISYDLFAIDTTGQPTVISTSSLGRNIPIYTVYAPVVSR